MAEPLRSPAPLRVGLTNVQGQGAVQLVASLLPAIERQKLAPIGRIDLPHKGVLSSYRPQSPRAIVEVYRRHLPNALSRLLECLRPIPGDSTDPLLTLGDVPLRTRGRQTVFIQNTHVISHQQGSSRAQAIKFAIMRAVFRRNLRYLAQAVVQTGLMQRTLVGAYPQLEGRVHVIRQPPPDWLLQQVAAPRPARQAEKLRLFYPAAAYPHKNHRLIDRLAAQSSADRLIASITVTLDQAPQASGGLVRHVGRLDPDAMRRHYAEADALIFPSLSESYGLPLVEAMWLGLPILCADLPYARELCGEEAFYFDPHDPASAHAAARNLRDRLLSGWRPDWSAQLERFPRDWDEVAHQLVRIAVEPPQ